MFLCTCAAVTEEEWFQALARHRHDFFAASMETGAGTGCGGCRVSLQIAAANLKSGENFQAPAPRPCLPACPPPTRSAKQEG